MFEEVVGSLLDLPTQLVKTMSNLEIQISDHIKSVETSLINLFAPKISFLLTKVSDQEIFLTELKHSVERLESENTTLRQLLEENKISLKNTRKKLEDVIAKNNNRWQSCNNEVTVLKEKVETKDVLDCKQISLRLFRYSQNSDLPKRDNFDQL